MREVIIAIRCDSCGKQFVEQEEGSNSVTFTIERRQWEMDLCSDCIDGPLFENARQVDKKKAKDFVCSCGKSFGTQRGLSHHQTRAHDGVV